MRTIATVTIATALLATAATAHAGSLGRPCTATQQSQWLSIDDLQAKIEAQGYTVRNAKLKNACGEFYTRDKNDQQVELFVDPTNGKIVGQR
ncbi:PepSY domain-containing protein [Bradyrhizobium guangdongense]|uniref:PepSY domain-containing protein n=1 Tax=Bradyrhizobium guangdongense TaxID=1325090 RepID=UPI0011294160|nr:PepSY domain-containing protein [Bradyrhizobium guangdongense]TPQ35329.1 PepSY domain-containing protein [Bradyrhizobium guangdongense]